MPDAQLTIVLPTWKRPARLRATLAQLRQNVTVPHEVYVFDNSPAEERPELAAHEHYVFLGRNLGAAARNLGVQQAAAPFVLMLDDDSYPLPDSIGPALDRARREGPRCAGLMAAIERPDGEREAALLPTVPQGCGVLLRTEVLRRLDGGYPEDFCFYGEEYWLAMQLSGAGYHLAYEPRLRIRHHSRRQPRDKARIFYYLARNNAVIWDTFAPAEQRDPSKYDSRRRYELLAAKEGVAEAFEQGCADALAAARTRRPLTRRQFDDVILLDRFARRLRRRQPRKALLCGCGKFPSLWARYLERHGVDHVRVADFNPGLVGQRFQDYEVRDPDAAARLARDGYTCILGHSSHVDTDRWGRFLADAETPDDAVLSLN